MDTEEEQLVGLASTAAEVTPNLVRDPLGQNNITKYSVGRVEKFLKANSLSMILRSH